MASEVAVVVMEAVEEVALACHLSMELHHQTHSDLAILTDTQALETPMEVIEDKITLTKSSFFLNLFPHQSFPFFCATTVALKLNMNCDFCF